MQCVKIDSTSNIFSSTYSYYKGNTFSTTIAACPTCPAAILNNGSFVQFSSWGWGNGTYGCNIRGINACGSIYVDINGNTGPNMIGEDTFPFYIVVNNNSGFYTILPFGAPGDNWVPLPGGCSAGSIASTTSEGCSFERLFNPNNMP